MNILLTGGCGFIGSHLVEYLVSKGHNLTVFDKYNSTGSLGWLEKSKVRKDVEFILGDIRDYDLVSKSLKKKQCVIHLAALIGIPYSYLSPLAYIRTNIEGTYNILESVKNHNIDQCIITSTSEVYGSAKTVKISEKHQLVGQSPYAASKIGADQMALSYFRSFGLPIKLIRPFNTFGPRQSLRAIIPTIILQLINKNKNLIMGNTYPKRDFTYVLDLCRAFELMIMKQSCCGEVINIGSGESISIKELANQAMKIAKYRPNIIKTDERKRVKNSEVDNLRCENKKALKLLKWKPKYSFLESLQKTFNWYLENHYKYQKNDIYQK
jgi:NAD dependent epimerase/dehydratase